MLNMYCVLITKYLNTKHVSQKLSGYTSHGSAPGVEWPSGQTTAGVQPVTEELDTDETKTTATMYSVSHLKWCPWWMNPTQWRKPIYLQAFIINGGSDPTAAPLLLNALHVSLQCPFAPSAHKINTQPCKHIQTYMLDVTLACSIRGADCSLVCQLSADLRGRYPWKYGLWLWGSIHYTDSATGSSLPPSFNH